MHRSGGRKAEAAPAPGWEDGTEREREREHTVLKEKTERKQSGVSARASATTGGPLSPTPPQMAARPSPSPSQRLGDAPPNLCWQKAPQPALLQQPNAWQRKRGAHLSVAQQVAGCPGTEQGGHHLLQRLLQLLLQRQAPLGRMLLCAADARVSHTLWQAGEDLVHLVWRQSREALWAPCTRKLAHTDLSWTMQKVPAQEGITKCTGGFSVPIWGPESPE